MDDDSEFIKIERQKGLSKENLRPITNTKQEAQDNKDKIIQMHEDGKSFASISNELQLTENSVTKLLKSNEVVKGNTKIHNNIYKNINHEFFNTIDTNDKAYALGFLFMIGSNRVSKNRITIETNMINIDILQKFKNWIYPNDDYEIKTYKEKTPGSPIPILFGCSSYFICQRLSELSIKEEN